jgi:class 3 adenylate cyclase
VRDDGAVSGSGDRVDTATVIAVAIDTLVTDLDPVDLAEALAATVDIAEGLAVTHDVDRIRVAADRSLFVSGAGTPDDGVDVGLAFAAALADGLHEFSERTSLEFTTHIGLSTGPIATGVLAQGNLTFAAWGEPVRRALAISALADTDEILVDAGTADAAGDAWTLVAADDVIDLDGQSMAVLRLVLPDHVDDLAAQRDRPVAEPAG